MLVPIATPEQVNGLRVSRRIDIRCNANAAKFWKRIKVGMERAGMFDNVNVTSVSNNLAFNKLMEILQSSPACSQLQNVCDPADSEFSSASESIADYDMLPPAAPPTVVKQIKKVRK